jgi:hypothetical protein
MPKLSGKVLAELKSRVFQVALINDVVAIEYGPGLVAGDIHGNPFQNASADQVAHSSASQIVKQQVLVAPLVLLP